MTTLLDGLSLLDQSEGDAEVCARFLESLGAARCDDLERADIVLTGIRSAETPAALAARYKRAIIVDVTPFGRDGPYAEYRGSELVCSAMSGALRACGYPDRAPVKEAGDACWFHANAMAAAGAMFALNVRDETGEGQIVDVSVQEVAASRMTNGILAWQFDKRLLLRAGPATNYGVATVRCVWDLADGFVFHSLMTGKFGAPANQALSDWMTERGADNPMRDVDWQRYDRSALPAETRAVWEAAIAAFFKTLTKAEIASDGRRRGINATPANEPADVVKDEHLRAREFFEPMRSAGCSALAPRRFVRVVEPPAANAVPRPSARRAEGRGPLAGIRVLDFSWALVGSFTTKALGDFGAQVVKVESSLRPCLSRLDVQVSASKRGEFDDKPWFAHLNTSKLGLKLNLKRPESRAVLDRLVDWADIVVENFSPGTMKSLGLDYATLSARRPDLIMVSGSVYGQTGPLAREWGVDGTGAALSGRLALTGWPDRTPIPPSAVPYGDVILPPMMVAAAIAAVHARRKTGLGRHIDASMYEACAQQMAPQLLASQLGASPRRDGNRDPGVLCQGVYPCDGDDRWIAISAATEAERAALARIVGSSATDSDTLDADIAAWSGAREAHRAMRDLQEAGIAAGVVQDASEVIADPQLRQRGFLQQLDHALLGAFEHQATPISLSRSERPIYAPPRLGEHDDYVCRTLLGMSEADIEALCAADVFV